MEIEVTSVPDFTIIIINGPEETRIPCHSNKLTKIEYFRSLFESNMNEAIQKHLILRDVNVEAVNFIINSLDVDPNSQNINIDIICNVLIQADLWLYNSLLEIMNAKLLNLDILSFLTAIEYYNFLPKSSQSIIYTFSQSEEFCLKIAPNLQIHIIEILIDINASIYNFVSLLSCVAYSPGQIPKLESSLSNFNLETIFASRSYLIRNIYDLGSKIASMKLHSLLLSKVQSLILVRNKYDLDVPVITLDEFNVSKIVPMPFYEKLIPGNQNHRFCRMDLMYNHAPDNQSVNINNWILELPVQRLQLKFRQTKDNNNIRYQYTYAYKPDISATDKFRQLYSSMIPIIEKSKMFLKLYNFDTSAPEASGFTHPLYLQSDLDGQILPNTSSIIYISANSNYNKFTQFIDANSKKIINPDKLLDRAYSITILVKMDVYVYYGKVSITRKIYKAYIHDYIESNNITSSGAVSTSIPMNIETNTAVPRNIPNIPFPMGIPNIPVPMNIHSSAPEYT